VSADSGAGVPAGPVQDPVVIVGAPRTAMPIEQVEDERDAH